MWDIQKWWTYKQLGCLNNWYSQLRYLINVYSRQSAFSPFLRIATCSHNIKHVFLFFFFFFFNQNESSGKNLKCFSSRLPWMFVPKCSIGNWTLLVTVFTLKMDVPGLYEKVGYIQILKPCGDLKFMVIQLQQAPQHLTYAQYMNFFNSIFNYHASFRC